MVCAVVDLIANVFPGGGRKDDPLDWFFPDDEERDAVAALQAAAAAKGARDE
jgi:hypothetical protein